MVKNNRNQFNKSFTGGQYKTNTNVGSFLGSTLNKPISTPISMAGLSSGQSVTRLQQKFQQEHGQSKSNSNVESNVGSTLNKTNTTPNNMGAFSTVQSTAQSKESFITGPCKSNSNVASNVGSTLNQTNTTSNITRILTTEKSTPQSQSSKNNIPQVEVKIEPKIEMGCNIGKDDCEIIKIAEKKENENELTVEDMNVDNKEEKSAPFFKKVFTGVKKKTSVRAKEKKIRQNRRLRKVLLPKNALMALHEVKNINIGDFNINARSNGGYTAEVNVNDTCYIGLGISKNAAKNNACEKALRDLIISKMSQKPKKSENNASDENISTIDEPNNDDNEDSEMKSEENEDDDVPMINLASFALYKLFTEWENEGFEIPTFRQSSHNGQTASAGVQLEKIKKNALFRSELPANWETLHPTMLLCTMRPGITYVELGYEGQAPNIIQRVGVNVDEDQFIGVGRSKKAARKDAAIQACNKLFNTTFEAEDVPNYTS